MAYSLATAAIAFVIAMILAPTIIGVLERGGIGKGIREDGPERHHSKSGTITMGGLIILISALITTVAFNIQGRSILVPLGTMVAHGLLGAIDDIRHPGGPRRGRAFGAAQVRAAGVSLP